MEKASDALPQAPPHLGVAQHVKRHIPHHTADLSCGGAGQGVISMRKVSLSTSG
jgi:hypothetical protein